MRFDITPSPSPLDVPSLTRSIPSEPNVLVLCYGNICRSPLAERYLQSVAAERGINNMSVTSAGLRTEAGRSSPDAAVRVGREFGVDLSEHRSKPVTEELLQWSDAVFIMDLLNYTLLRRDFGDRDEQTFFLGTFTDGEYEIVDPHGEDLDSYRTVYSEVANSIDEFVDTLEPNR